MTSWLKSHATRLELIGTIVLSCFIASGVSMVLIYQITSSVVESKIGNTAERLEAITERIERQLDEMKKITMTQNNEQRVVLPDTRAELEDQRLRDIHQAMGNLKDE